MITLQDLKKEAGEFQYNSISNISDYVGDRCIEKAKTTIECCFAYCGKNSSNIDWNSNIINEVLLKFSLYELWSFGEMEETAKDKQKDGVRLLASILGKCVFDYFDNTGEIKVESNSCAKVISGKRNIYGYN